MASSIDWAVEPDEQFRSGSDHVYTVCFVSHCYICLVNEAPLSYWLMIERLIAFIWFCIPPSWIPRRAVHCELHSRCLLCYYIMLAPSSSPHHRDIQLIYDLRIQSITFCDMYNIYLNCRPILFGVPNSMTSSIEQWSLMTRSSLGENPTDWCSNRQVIFKWFVRWNTLVQSLQ